MNTNIQQIGASLPVGEPSGLATSDLLHRSFELQVGRNGDHSALEIGGEKVSYSELNARADAVAHDLTRRGVTVGDFVVVHIERSMDLFACLLGVLKAGAAYVPIDVATAREAATGIAAKWNPKLIVTSAQAAGNFAPHLADRIVPVEQIDTRVGAVGLLTVEGLSGASISQVIFRVRPDGSCKGVEVTHGEAVRFIRSVGSVYGIGAEDRCYQDGSLALDVAVEELLAMLAAGATVVVGNGDIEAGSAEAEQFIDAQKITLLSTVPESLKTIDSGLANLDILVVGGRPCPAELSAEWAMKTRRMVSLKSRNDRFPSFSIEQESGRAWRPRMLYARACESPAR